MLSSRSFIVLCFMFRPMIHFGLVFVKGERSMSRVLFPFPCFFFLHMDAQLFKHRLLKRLSLPHWIAFAASWAISWLCVDCICDVFLGSLFCTDDLFVLSSVPHCLDYFIINLGVSILGLPGGPGRFLTTGPPGSPKILMFKFGLISYILTSIQRNPK